MRTMLRSRWWAAVAVAAAWASGCEPGSEGTPLDESCTDSLECHVGACRVLVPICEGEPAPSCPPAMPAPAEVCGDGIDNTCDGQVDEGCACDDGAVHACYMGAPVTRGVGLCADGQQVCAGGAWSPCQGSTLPVHEACDQHDNDCDGEVDEGCSCNEGQQQPCYGGPEYTIGVGACESGVQTCVNATWSDCQGDVTPTVEQCDGVDNDCDGVVDIDASFCDCAEGEAMPCYNGPPGTAAVGQCSAGSRHCAGGMWQEVCDGEVLPSPEVCDGLDNDCDGEADEGIPDIGLACQSPYPGACGPGAYVCTSSGLFCQPSIQPGQLPEACDGLDNDCNGVEDDGQFCCPDGVVSGNETDVDCGGACAADCQVGQGCNVAADCVTSACVGNVCVPATCNDGIPNGDESDVDCGGSCPPCAVGQICDIDADCTTNVCDPVTQLCVANQLGSPCQSAAECASNHCIDGVCCDTACAGTCAACTAARKGAGQDGICGNIVVGSDPDSECAAESPATCGDTGVCDGFGSCQLYPAGTACASAMCLDATTSAGQDICNGVGICVDTGGVSCVPYGCNAATGACRVDCATNQDCAAGYHCNGAMCVPNGAAVCVVGSDCLSGFCVDGVCCDTACSGLCMACSAVRKGGGADGNCGSIAAGTDPDSECQQDPPSTCGNTGVCNGATACDRYPAGTVCAAPSCADATTLNLADVCDGTGVCIDGGIQSCSQMQCVSGACQP